MKFFLFISFHFISCLLLFSAFLGYGRVTRSYPPLRCTPMHPSNNLPNILPMLKTLEVSIFIRSEDEEGIFY